jgi:hypothetical protein
VPLAAAALTVSGLAVLLWGTARAAPFAFFGTAEERASMESGRQLMLLATALLVVAALLVASRAGIGRALAVAAPGVLATAAIYAFPKSALAWLPLLVLGPVALVVALAALRE